MSRHPLSNDGLSKTPSPRHCGGGLFLAPVVTTMHDISPELTAKRDRLLELLRSYGSCAVAFSGGLDSPVVAKAAQLALGARAVAVTGASASLAVGELEEARQLAATIGIRHEIIETQELAIPQYQENTGNRCFYCKNELFARIDRKSTRLN